MDVSHQAFEQVNERLALIGRGDVQIDVSSHLRVAADHFLVDLLEGSIPRRRLFRQYLVLMGKLIKDDLFGPIWKMAAVVVYGVAVVLPPLVRPGWVSIFHGFSRWKEMIRRVSPVGRFRSGSRPGTKKNLVGAT